MACPCSCPLLLALPLERRDNVVVKVIVGGSRLVAAEVFCFEDERGRCRRGCRGSRGVAVVTVLGMCRRAVVIALVQHYQADMTALCQSRIGPLVGRLPVFASAR